MGRPEWTPPFNAILCSKHFTDDNLCVTDLETTDPGLDSVGSSLKDYAVPTLFKFPRQYIGPKQKSAMEKSSPSDWEVDPDLTDLMTCLDRGEIGDSFIKEELVDNGEALEKDGFMLLNQEEVGINRYNLRSI